MRFCMVSTQQNWGGGEELLHSLATELRLDGHEVRWIARDGSQVVERLNHQQQPVDIALHGRGFNVRDWWATRQFLRRWAPDVVVLNDSHSVPVVGSASWFGRQPRPLRVAYKHTIFPLRSPLKYRLLCDQLVCVSEAARETTLRGGLPGRLSHVIYGGCPPVSVPAETSQQLRRQLGISDSQRLLVSVGSLLACKGHQDLLNALVDIKPSHPEVRLVIAGEGVERASLESQIERLNLQQQVRLLGYRHDAVQLLAAADVVVHPSHAEGLSLVLIQAQMLARPIVATAVGGTKEVLQADNSELCSSWIAEAANPAALTEQLRRALAAVEQPSQEFMEKLQRSALRVRETFDIHRNTQLLADACAQWLEHRRSAA